MSQDFQSGSRTTGARLQPARQSRYRGESGGFDTRLVGPGAASPLDDLLSSGHDFSLFEAVDLIDDIAAGAPDGTRTGSEGARSRHFAGVAADTVGQANARRVGAYLSPSKERVRFRAARHMGFPAADIARISFEEAPADAPGRPSAHYVIEAACLGLYGPDSPLPAYVNERIVARDRDATALRDFLDLFNHRILTLLCRIARRYRHIRVFDGAATDEISLLAGALAGEPDPGARPPDGEARSHRLRNGIRLGRFGMSARTLEAVVSDRFGGIDVRVEEFVRRTVFIRDEQRNRLGERGTVLGRTALLGDRVASRSSKVRVWLGDFGPGQLRAFLPGGDARRVLDALLGRLLPAPFACDVILRVGAGAVTPLRLGVAGRLAFDALLGEIRDEVTLDFRVAA